MRILLLAVLLSGCLAGHGQGVDMQLALHYNAAREDTFTQVAVHHRAGAHVYDALGRQHPGGTTALDVLEAYAQASGVTITYGVEDERFQVMSLDGVPGGHDAGHWWAVDGQAADQAACLDVDQHQVTDRLTMVRFDVPLDDRRDTC